MCPPKPPFSLTRSSPTNNLLKASTVLSPNKVTKERTNKQLTMSYICNEPSIVLFVFLLLRALLRCHFLCLIPPISSLLFPSLVFCLVLFCHVRCGCYQIWCVIHLHGQDHPLPCVGRQPCQRGLGNVFITLFHRHCWQRQSRQGL